MKHKHEAEREPEVAGDLNFEAHSRRRSFCSKAIPPKPPQTVPSAGDQVFKFLGDFPIQNTVRPGEFIDRSHLDQFSIRTLHTENRAHTLHELPPPSVLAPPPALTSISLCHPFCPISHHSTFHTGCIYPTFPEAHSIALVSFMISLDTLI